MILFIIMNNKQKNKIVNFQLRKINNFQMKLETIKRTLNKFKIV